MPEIADSSGGDSRGEYQLSPRERELRDELSAIDPELGGLYEHGLPLLQKEGPGVAHLISHVGRELLNGIVRALRPASEGQPVVGDVPQGEDGRRGIAAVLSLQVDDPRVTLWFRTHGTLQRATHVRTPGESPPNLPEVREAWGLLESLLHARVGQFFRTLEGLDALLAKERPDASDVRALQSRLLRPAQAQYFYSTLENPAWLPLLQEAGLLQRPPGRVTYPDGSWRGGPWPEGLYLLRVAPVSADLVASVLEALSRDHGNPNVWRRIVEIIAALPPDHAARLSRVLYVPIREGLSFYLGPEVLQFAVRLVSFGHDVGFGLVRRLMHVPEELPENTPRWRIEGHDVFPNLEHLFYQDLPDALDQLAKVDTWKTAELLVNRWKRAASIAGDRRLVWGVSGTPRDDLGSLFVQTIGLLGRVAGESATAARRMLDLIGDGTDDTSMRMRLGVLARAAPHCPRELDSLLTSEYVVDEDYDYGREIAHVLREGFRFASREARAAFAARIEQGPSAELMERLGARGGEPDNLAEVADYWRQRRLRWFRGAIPDELRDLAMRVGGVGAPTFEEQEMAEVGSYASAGYGGEDPTPISAEDLLKMPIDQVVRFLEGWEPKEDAYLSGTSEGLYHAVRRVATEDPERALELFEHLAPGPSIYLEAILSGIEDAHRGGCTTRSASRLVQVLRWAVDARIETDSGDAERQNLRSALDTLRELCRQNLAPRAVEEDLREVMSRAVQHAGVWSHQDGSDWTTIEAIESASLNHVAGRVTHALVELALWTYRGLGDQKRDLTPQFGSLLDHILRQDRAQGRVAAEAALGSLWPYVSLTCPAWVEQNTAALMDGGAVDPVGRPAWSQYLIRSLLYDRVFEQLRHYYEVAAATPQPSLPRGRHSLGGKLADHILVAVLRGLTSVDNDDGIVRDTFTTVAPKDLQGIYWAVFRGWTDREEPPPREHVANLIELWGWRLDQLESTGGGESAATEAAGFVWLLRTPHIPDCVLISHGARSARIARGSFVIEPDWERVAQLANNDPDGAFGIVEPVIDAQLSADVWKVRAHEIKPALATIIATGAENTRLLATRLANRLGEAGFSEFRELAGD